MQLVIEEKWQKYIFLGHLTEGAQFDLKMFYRGKIMPEQADFLGGWSQRVFQRSL
jgi:hypothetical protein